MEQFLESVLADGQRRDPDAYPRATAGYLATCTRCGRVSAFYYVLSSPMMAEQATGNIACGCRAAFEPPSPWDETVVSVDELIDGHWWGDVYHLQPGQEVEVSPEAEDWRVTAPIEMRLEPLGPRRYRVVRHYYPAL